MLCCFAGSSTACIVVLDRRSHRLHTCNLGDSGFLVVRGGEVVHRSDEQQHYFNTPFQLSIAPPGAEGVVLSDRLVAQFMSKGLFFLAIHITQNLEYEAISESFEVNQCFLAPAHECVCHLTKQR